MERFARVYIGVAVMWALGAAALWLWAMRLPWVPQAPFDILGVLWLLTNLPRRMLHGRALLFLLPLHIAWARPCASITVDVRAARGH